MGRRLGILVLSEPEAEDLATIQGLCQAASETGGEVEVFLMGDAVAHLGSQALEALARAGAAIGFCALNAMERSMDRHSLYPWGLEEGSQYTLACLVERSDRFLVFT